MHDRIAQIERQLAAGVDLNIQRGALMYLNARPSLQPHISEDEAINAYTRVIHSYDGVESSIAAFIAVASMVIGLYSLAYGIYILVGIAFVGLFSCSTIANYWVTREVSEKLDEAFQAIAAANKNRRSAPLIDRHAPALPPQGPNGRASVAAYFDVPPQR